MFLTKRRKLILTALLLSASFLITQLLNIQQKFEAIAVLTVFTYWLTVWSLLDDLKGIEWLTLMILPTMFTAGVGMFYFLLPARWYTQLPIAVLYAVGMYALLLTENIYSVAAIRTIKLLNAAHAVGLMITLFTGFLLFDTVLSFKLSAYLNFFWVVLISFPLILGDLWAVNLEEQSISPQIRKISLAMAVIVGEVAWVLSFWPAKVSLASFFLVALMYVGLGLARLRLARKLFQQSQTEYLWVMIIAVSVMIFATRWGGY